MEAIASKERTVHIFADAAPVYDSVIPWFRYFGRVLAAAVSPGSGDRVLDVATGRGAVLFGLLDHMGASGSVVGVDLTPAMVALTGRDLSMRGATGATALVADSEDLPFRSQSFDVVTCGHAVNFFPDADRALVEMKRVTRVGGRVAISLLAAPDTRIDFFPEMALRVVPEERLRAALPPEKLDGQRRRVFDPAEQLARIGFTDIEVTTAAADFVLPDEDAWWAWAQTHGDRVFFDLLDGAALEDLKRECFARLRRERQPEGFVLHDRIQIAIAVRTT